ncbi:MAG: DUF6365 family protein [Mycobacteriales bacterium]
MKVLLLALSSAGYGETLIGLSLARQLAAAGHECRFVTEEMSVPLLRGSPFPFVPLQHGMGPLARLVVDEEVHDWRPDLIVLSDYFTYCGVFAKRFGLDPWFVDGYGIPVVPIDIWEWARAGFEVDVFCGKRMQVDDHILDYPAWLRPVPLCHTAGGDEPRSYPFSLATGDEAVTRRTRRHLREVLGIPPTDRLVMLALARWQLPEYNDDNGNRVASLVPDLLVRCLAELPERTHVIQVGDRMSGLELLDPARAHHVPACSPSRFNVLLGSVDLFLGLNVGATTLARAVLAGVSGVVVTNSYALRSPDEAAAAVETRGGRMDDRLAGWLRQAMPLYPFRMWPLGFHSFLSPLLADNAYTEAFRQVELVDTAGIVRTVERELYDPAAAEALAAGRRHFRRQLDSLPPTAEVFEKLAGSLGLR